MREQAHHRTIFLSDIDLGASGHGQPALIGIREKFRGKFLTNLFL